MNKESVRKMMEVPEIKYSKLNPNDKERIKNMKTIEWLAAEKYQEQRNLPAHKQMRAENFIDWAQFGAREAQRWISVEDELPHTGESGISDNVILQLKVYGKKQKNEYQCCIEAYYDSDTEEWFFMLPVDKRNLTLTPLSWRPIERV